MILHLLLAVGVVLCLGRESSADGDTSVDLVRDEWGIAHVFAETDAGAMYGLGYATAQDRGFQMHYQLRMIQGRSAEVLGDIAKTRPNGETTLIHDRRMRTFGLYRTAQRVATHLDSQTLALLQAYSEGVNAFFAQGRPHPLYAEVGLAPEPWTPADCIASWWQVGQFFGTDGTRDLNAYRNLNRTDRPNPQPRVDDAAAIVQREDVDAEWIARTEQYLREHGYDLAGSQKPVGENGPKFSHTWAVGGGKTTTGSAVLVSDPQTPVTNPSLFYEFHIRGETFDARGIGTPGSPLILIGFNREVAWGVTALGADQADLFRLQTDAAHPEQYFFDGEWRSSQVRHEVIAVKGADSIALDVRETHLGPVVTEFAFARPGEPQVAQKRIPGWEQERDTIQGALAMLRAKSTAAFERALEGWRFPSVNVVFADRAGDIGYRTALALPLRSPQAPNVGRAAHDGTESRFDWQGIVPHDLMPHVTNPRSGYLFSANHRPIGSFYPIPLTVSTGSAGHNIRSLRLAELLEGKEQFAPEDVLAMHYDAINPARRDIVAIAYHLRDKASYAFSPQAVQALDYLETWFAEGGSADLNIAGAELVGQINLLFRLSSTDLTLQYGGGETGLVALLRSVRRRINADEGTVLEPSESEYIDALLAAAWRRAENRYGRETADWPERARREVSEQRMGYFEGLHAFPSLDSAHDLALPPLTVIDGGTIRSQRSQSYTQFVPLHDVDRAQSILPIGQSEDPASPFYASTLALWERGQLHPAPLTRDEVEKYMVSSQSLEAGRTAVEESADAVPAQFSLAQNFPNPFNGETAIRYALRTDGKVQLTIYTLSGQVAHTWTLEHAAAGSYAVQWDGRDGNGREMASGTYLYRMETEGYLQQKKMLLLR